MPKNINFDSIDFECDEFSTVLNTGRNHIANKLISAENEIFKTIDARETSRTPNDLKCAFKPYTVRVSEINEKQAEKSLTLSIDKDPHVQTKSIQMIGNLCLFITCYNFLFNKLKVMFVNRKENEVK